MTLIICSECGKQISDKADYCIGCGCPMEEIIKNKTLETDRNKPSDIQSVIEQPSLFEPEEIPKKRQRPETIIFDEHTIKELCSESFEFDVYYQELQEAIKRYDELENYYYDNSLYPEQIKFNLKYGIPKIKKGLKVYSISHGTGIVEKIKTNISLNSEEKDEYIVFVLYDAGKTVDYNIKNFLSSHYYEEDSSQFFTCPKCKKLKSKKKNIPCFDCQDKIKKEELKITRIIENANKNLLKIANAYGKLRIPYYYQSYCYNCHTLLNSQYHKKCNKCRWLICPTCGACGCNYYVNPR